MTTLLSFLLIVSVILLTLTWIMYRRAQMLIADVRLMKDEISQLKNMGDLLNVAESTLEEAGKAINTAKRVMDGRIHRMEELLGEIDGKIPDLERQVKTNRNLDEFTRPEYPSGKTASSQRMPDADPDAQEREFIAKRNRRIILLLEEGKTVEEIARVTGASVREIQLIKKFVK